MPEPDPTAPTGVPVDPEVVIIGGGPAGLTAAYHLSAHGHSSTVLEADDILGGISRTVERDGWRFDIGGHRFYTRIPAVERIWNELLEPDEFLTRPRMSRIYYDGKFYDYPLRLTNALRNLGVLEALRCVASYLWARVRPPKDQSNFEGWMAARFGWRLYHIFFKTYTEKVWGVPATDISADWAAQRIKNLSLAHAVTNALRRGRSNTITSLIDEFKYPKYGPGMMWERCAEVVGSRGTKIHTATKVERVTHTDGRVVSVTAIADGARTTYTCRQIISSMALPDLLRAMDPPPPDLVLQAADAIGYRDFLTVALVVNERNAFPDNWIYVHSPEVRLGRIQNYGAWSPFMVKDGRTCLGLEYFVDRGGDLWEMDDDDLIALGTREIAGLGLVDPSHVDDGYVVRMPRAYPMYDEHYQANVAVMRAWLAEHVPDVYPVGRNGMHKYNSQDHSMYTAMLSVENILGASHDPWTVNVEAEYAEDGHILLPEEKGTGREAPVIPRHRPSNRQD